MLTLVEAAGAPALRDAEAQRLHVPQHGRAWLQSSGIEASGAVVLAPTSRWVAKQWPAERFAQVARGLAESGRRVLIVGGASERGQIEPLLREAEGHSIIDLTGQTSVAGLMAVIEKATLVIANDSAALHLAVALGRPTIALFGPTDAAQVGPYQREFEVIQHVGPGEHSGHKDARNQRLMLRIEVDEVLTKAAMTLAHVDRRGAGGT
jgi:ADP-heptose:LPS heptosyltransferase